MDGLQPAGTRALHIFDEIIKEQDTRCGNAEHIDDVSISIGLRFAQADIGRHENLLKRAQQISEPVR